MFRFRIVWLAPSSAVVSADVTFCLIWSGVGRVVFAELAEALFIDFILSVLVRRLST
jgi:hypothetical protein